MRGCCARVLGVVRAGMQWRSRAGNGCDRGGGAEQEAGAASGRTRSIMRPPDVSFDVKPCGYKGTAAVWYVG